MNQYPTVKTEAYCRTISASGQETEKKQRQATTTDEGVKPFFIMTRGVVKITNPDTKATGWVCGCKEVLMNLEGSSECTGIHVNKTIGG